MLLVEHCERELDLSLSSLPAFLERHNIDTEPHVPRIVKSNYLIGILDTSYC